MLKVIQLHLFRTQLERSLVTDVRISNTHTEWSLWGVGVMVRAVGGSKYTCRRARSASKNMSFFSLPQSLIFTSLTASSNMH
jgi:hypothetical protein